ncbi:MAG: pilus assembly PilX N-terminal domain-containing protein [Candidatus Omnitrophica bacterium]|nr:pilus assembly PilX N-terminal domain-containing protein [Candidatus Omnitrophota bacterium]
MNNKGIALILSYVVIMVLTMLGAIFLSRSAVESKLVTGHSNSTHAFWIAEAGLSWSFQNLASGGTGIPVPNPSGFGGGNYQITVTPVGLSYQITSTGSFGNSSRQVSATAYRVPSVFENTISTGEDFHLRNGIGVLYVDGKTRISEDYIDDAWLGAVIFADKQEDLGDTQYTTLEIPDCDGNGTNDQYSDFLAFGQLAMNNYPSNQVAYIETSGTVEIDPSCQELQGKKIIYVEGPSEGSGGNVEVTFNTTWEPNSDVTIISTGNVEYVEPITSSGSRLNIICWGEYTEGSVLYDNHESVIFAHSNYNNYDVFGLFKSTGNFITNQNFETQPFISGSWYHWSNRSINGDLGPGFELFGNPSGTFYLTGWKEIIQ